MPNVPMGIVPLGTFPFYELSVMLFSCSLKFFRNPFPFQQIAARLIQMITITKKIFYDHLDEQINKGLDFYQHH